MSQTNERKEEREEYTELMYDIVGILVKHKALSKGLGVELCDYITNKHRTELLREMEYVEAINSKYLSLITSKDKHTDELDWPLYSELLELHKELDNRISELKGEL